MGLDRGQPVSAASQRERVRARRRTAIAVMATMTIAIIAALIAGHVMAPASTIGVAAPGRGAPAADPGTPLVRWMVDVGERRTAPELAVHAPVALGDRLLVAGSRVGYVALDRATGAVAWRRWGGPALAPPLVLEPHDVILVHDCDAVVAAPPGAAVVGCFERIDPLDISARSAGSITAPIARAADCTAPGGVWRLERAGAEYHIERGACTLAFAIPDGTGRAIDPLPSRTAPLPSNDDCGHLPDGTTWCQIVEQGASHVILAGALAPRLPGLSLLAHTGDATRGAAVVRLDATLRNDVLVAFAGDRIVWTWPLPAPTTDRATPIGLALAGDTLYVHFDTSRVAALVAPP